MTVSCAWPASVTGTATLPAAAAAAPMSAPEAISARARSSSVVRSNVRCATCFATRGPICAWIAETIRCTAVFSPQPMQAPSPPTIERYVAFLRSSPDSTPMPSSTSATLMNRSSVSGRRFQSAQLRRSLSSAGASCRIVTSAPSGQTSTQRLQPLHASGFTVIESNPPDPFCFRSAASKNGAVRASGNSLSRACTIANSASVAARRSASHPILPATAS